MDIGRRKKKQSFLQAKLVILVLVAILFFVARATWNVYEKQQDTRENLAETRESFNELVDREKKLNSKLDSLSATSGIEREIRETFGVAKEGEGVIVIVDNERGLATSSQEDENPSLLDKILDIFDI